MASNYRPAGLSDSSDSDDDYDTSYPPPNHYFIPDFTIPLQISSSLPIRPGHWLQIFVKFNNLYECTFNRTASELLLTAPSGISMFSHIVCFDEFKAHIVFLHNQGLTLPWHFWEHFLNTEGINRHNFISKMSDHLQLCTGCNVLLRWRSDLIDY